MHLRPPEAQAAVRSKVVVLLLFIRCCSIMGFCSCSTCMCCCALLSVHSTFANILIGKRKLIALLRLSSWCDVAVVCIFLLVPRVCLLFVIDLFPDHTHLLFIILL